MDCVLQTFGLTKKYKRQLAVNEADITISRGDIYGFVGENGSGKTTIIRLITGLIFPNSGSFELFGINNNSNDIKVARRKVGAVVENPSIYLNMSGYDNLKMQCMLLGLPVDDRIDKTLNEVGLGELVNDKKHAGNYSLGMRQRLGIAMALIGEPQFLILDEPMNGLDPAGIVEVRELILKLNRERNITFLISSHILSELSLVATDGEECVPATDSFMMQENEAAIRLRPNTKFTTLWLEEDVKYSQRVELFSVFADGKHVGDYTTIGSGRIIRFPNGLDADEIDIVITQSRSNPIIKSIRLYK